MDHSYRDIDASERNIDMSDDESRPLYTALTLAGT